MLTAILLVLFLCHSGGSINVITSEKINVNAITNVPRLCDFVLSNDDTKYMLGLVRGTVNSLQTNDQDVFIAKYVSNGTLTDVKIYGTSASDACGALALSYSKAGLSVLALGVGAQYGSSNTYYGGLDFAVVWLDSSMSVSQIAQYGTVNDDTPNYVTVDNTGNVYVAGQTTGNFTSINDTTVLTDHCFVAKLSQLGSVLWIKDLYPLNCKGMVLIDTNQLLITGDTGAPINSTVFGQKVTDAPYNTVRMILNTNTGEMSFFELNNQPQDEQASSLYSTSNYYYVGGYITLLNESFSDSLILQYNVPARNYSKTWSLHNTAQNDRVVSIYGVGFPGSGGLDLLCYFNSQFPLNRTYIIYCFYNNGTDLVSIPFSLGSTGILKSLWVDSKGFLWSAYSDQQSFYYLVSWDYQLPINSNSGTSSGSTTVTGSTTGESLGTSLKTSAMLLLSMLCFALLI